MPPKFGKYVLLERLGHGGMAEIFKAKTFGAEGFEKVVAIKRILPHLGSNKEFVDMLVHEAKISVQLSHANIVQVLDLGKISGILYIVMEFVEGMDLRTLTQWLIQVKRTLSLHNAILITAEICKGLDYAHKKLDAAGKPLGIVHRDINPPNIFVSVAGEIKVGDFGIAKAASKISATEAGLLKGKLAYMSPEQSCGEDVDCRTDIFATGLIFYELITGKQLYEGFFQDSTVKILERIRNFNFESFPQNPPFPASIRSILSKSLASRPQDRYASANDMKLDLNNLLRSPELDLGRDDLVPIIQVVYQHELKARRKREAEDQSFSLESMPDILPSNQPQPSVQQSLLSDFDHNEPFYRNDFSLSADGKVETMTQAAENQKPSPPPKFRGSSGLELQVRSNRTSSGLELQKRQPARRETRVESERDAIFRQILSFRNLFLVALGITAIVVLTHLQDFLFWFEKARLAFYQWYLQSMVKHI